MLDCSIIIDWFTKKALCFLREKIDWPASNESTKQKTISINHSYENVSTTTTKRSKQRQNPQSAQPYANVLFHRNITYGMRNRQRYTESQNRNVHNGMTWMTYLIGASVFLVTAKVSTIGKSKKDIILVYRSFEHRCTPNKPNIYMCFAYLN